MVGQGLVAVECFPGLFDYFKIVLPYYFIYLVF